MTSIGPLAFSIWSFLLALGWLLPNHYLPWTAFHSEAWVALLLLTAVPFVLCKMPKKCAVTGVPAYFLLVAVIPFVQFVLGRIGFFGQAWICSIYLFGLLLSVLFGESSESLGKSGDLIDKLVFSIVLAALVSVGLQSYQWLQLDGLGIWLMDAAPSRPPANLGQPNQLATLLVWGGLGVFWGVVRSKISTWVGVVLAAVMLFGVALTESRAAMLGMGFIVMFSWWWRKLWSETKTPWVISGLGLFYVACAAGLSLDTKVNRAIQLVTLPSESYPVDLRLSAWKVLVGAVMERPMFGYGWGQVAEAQLSVAHKYPALHVVFSQSHNLFLDLILWCGLPIGLFLSFFLIRWFFMAIRKVRTPETAVLMMFLVVVANHSMFEYPLQYAYLLMPAGLIFGVVSSRNFCETRQTVVRKAHVGVLWLLCTGMLCATLLDYMKIESSYRLLRAEWAGFNLERNPKPPEVAVLTQWHSFIKNAREVPRVGMDESEIDELRQLAMLLHKPIIIRNLSLALSLNGRHAEGELWLDRLCSVGGEENCVLAKKEFEERSKR